MYATPITLVILYYLLSSNHQPINMSCCPSGSVGAMGKLSSSFAGKTRTPKGKMVSLIPSPSSTRAPMPCYQVGGGGGGGGGKNSDDDVDQTTGTMKHLVLVFSDVHGIDSGNHKLFCDLLHEKLNDSSDGGHGNDDHDDQHQQKETTSTSASTKVAVWMPDIFRGYPMAPDLSKDTSNQLFNYINDWICRLSIIWAEKTRITVPNTYMDLQQVIQPNIPSSVTTVGMVGFCFGAWVIGKSYGWSNNNNHEEENDNDDDDSNDKNDKNAFYPNLNAGVLIHPSFRPENVIVGGSQTKMEMAISTRAKPLLILPGKQDVDFHSTSSIVQQMAKQRNMSNAEKLVIDYTNMDHGWVSRADSSHNNTIQVAQEQATQQTADFLKTHLGVN